MLIRKIFCQVGFIALGVAISGCSFNRPTIGEMCSQENNVYTQQQRDNSPGYKSCLKRYADQYSGSQSSSSSGGLAGAFNSIADGIAGAQKFQQPPPGFVYIPPGTSRSNYMTCTPDGRGGYYCK